MEFGNTRHLVSGALRGDLGHSDEHASNFLRDVAWALGRRLGRKAQTHPATANRADQGNGAGR